jgi:Family of unknown function (DUF5309)
MAVPANTTQTFTRVGIAEDISALITRIQQNTAIFSNIISNGPKAGNTLFQWQTDSLRAPDGQNKHVQGDDGSPPAASPSVMLNNNVQIMKDFARTSGTADAVTTYGREEEHMYQVVKITEQVVQDMEARFVGNFPKNSGAAAVASETAGAEAWLTNSNRGVGGANPAANAATVATDGTQRVFTEAMVKDVQQKCWAAGGAPTTLIVGGTQKQVASGFVGIATKFIDAKPSEQATIMGAADVYVGDFGRINIVASNISRNRSALLIEGRRWKKRYLRRPFKELLAKTGDSRTSHIVMEVGLECTAPTANGVIADLS